MQINTDLNNNLENSKYDENINYSDELLKLQKLKAVDMRSIMLSPGFQSKWQDRMPQVTWYFDAPCHCVD